MQLKYVFSETGIGLRRNVSMTVALVVTIFISLTLVGMGLLLNTQAHKAEQSWGDKLQITVFLCNQTSRSAQCSGGEATQQQKQQVRQVLSSNPEVASYYHQSKEQAFRIWKRVYVAKDASDKAVYSTVRPSAMQESYWVKLKDPNRFTGVESALSGLPGVDSVRDLRTVLSPIYFWMTTMRWAAIVTAGFLLVAAVLQVANMIRLAAYARRKEIGIMRLVGASSLYISLPFLIETLVAALVGVGLAALSIVAFTQFVVYGRLRGNSKITEWINWGDSTVAIVLIAALGILLAVVPTLVVTRKYLRV